MDLVALDTDGFVILENSLNATECLAWCDRLLEAIDQAHHQGRLQANPGRTIRDRSSKDDATPSTQGSNVTYGSRNLLSLCPAVVQLLKSPAIFAACEAVLGPRFGVVRGLYFDKPPGLSWSLPWHQDLTIAVAEHVALSEHQREHLKDAFSKPTTKAGVCHVEAPQSLLEKMLTVRIHLDAMDSGNGPVVVRKGSHRAGKSLHQESPQTSEITEIHCGQGAAMLMRPLLSHSSIASKPDSLAHRRTIHLELSATEVLPYGFRWKDYVMVV